MYHKLPERIALLCKAESSFTNGKVKLDESYFEARPVRGIRKDRKPQAGSCRQKAAGRKLQAESCRQKAAGRKPKTESRRQKAEDRKPQTESRRQKAADRKSQAGSRRQKTLFEACSNEAIEVTPRLSKTPLGVNRCQLLRAKQRRMKGFLHRRIQDL